MTLKEFFDLTPWSLMEVAPLGKIRSKEEPIRCPLQMWMTVAGLKGHLNAKDIRDIIRAADHPEDSAMRREMIARMTSDQAA